MKKILYLTNYDEYQEKKSFGVVNKIDAQIRQFEAAGCNVILKSTKMQRRFPDQILILNPFASFNNWEEMHIDETIDVVYIRFIISDFPFVRMLRRFKKENPKVKILMEIPSYPYEQEMLNEHFDIATFLLYSKDKFYGKFLHKYINRIVLIASDLKEVFGISTITISNGVEYNRILPRKTENRDTNDIHMIAVSSFAYWHGYDRLIAGMGQYYKMQPERNIYLHLVGAGETLEQYMEITKQYGMTSQVIFEGTLRGEKLDNVYNKSSLAIGCLGLHRKGALIDSSLKSKEYVTKGFPIVYSGKTDMENEMTNPYIKKVLSDESAIDIQELILFYDTVYDQKDTTKEMIVQNIRESFRPFADMNITFKPVIQYIQQL